MGSGASTSKAEGGKGQTIEDLREVVQTEQGKPTDAADVNTPRGVTAVEEVKRLRNLLAQVQIDELVMTKALMGSVPSLQEYLKRVFTKWDKDNSGSLSTEEFWAMMKGLELNITDAELTEIQRLTDADADGTLSLEEFVKGAPGFFKQAAETHEPDTQLDWMMLESEDGYAYYYNKRTQESRWDAPEDYIKSVDKVALDKEKGMTSDLKDYLTDAFLHADADGSGLLDADEFWNLLQNCTNHGLTEDDFNKLKHLSDPDQDGKIRWQEFILAADGIIRTINERYVHQESQE